MPWAAVRPLPQRQRPPGPESPAVTREACMKIEITGKFDHPIERVYEVMYHRFEQFPSRIPNVLEIRELERKVIADDVHEQTVHRWTADPKLIPGFARPFIKPEVLQWLGVADWKHGEKVVYFDFRSHVFRDLYECKGEYRLSEKDGITLLAITAHLDIYSDRLPGVPNWFARRAVGIIEKLLMGAIEPSLAALPDAVEYYLAHPEAGRTATG